LQCLLFQVDESQIVVHEADDPDAFVDFLDTDALTGEHGREVDSRELLERLGQSPAAVLPRSLCHKRDELRLAVIGCDWFCRRPGRKAAGA
jgi:hypothetical protein